MKKKSSAAVELGRKGGKARARKLTAEQRSEIARKGGIALDEKRKAEKKV